MIRAYCSAAPAQIPRLRFELLDSHATACHSTGLSTK